jgi:hypothetical protein
VFRVLVHRTRSSVGTAPIGFLIALLGLWAVFAPLVGPYFEYGFGTDDTWAFTREQWILSFAPGIVVVAGGLAMLVPLRGPAWLGGLLAALGGAWLVVGPSLYPLFSSGGLEPAAAAEWKTALLWVGYFYGTGALVLLLSGLAQGLASRPVEVVGERRLIEPSTVEETEVIEDPERKRALLYP